MLIKKIAIALMLLAANQLPARSAGAVIGDSLGVGVSWAAKFQSLAKNSIAIHGGAILEQIRQLPRGTTAFMSLGTNDAVGGALDVKKPVQNIVAAADAQGVRLVWLGPPCVLKPWETHAKQLDAILRNELAGTSVTYVSMRDASMCTASARARDGVHFTMAGYTSMWQKAAEAAGFPVAAASSGGSQPAVKKKLKKKKKKARKKPSKPGSAAPQPQAKPSET